MNDWTEDKSDLRNSYGQKGRSYLAKRLVVKPESLQRLNAGYDKEKKCFTFPECDSMSQISGIVRRPKSGNGEKKAIQGCKRGLYIPEDFDSLRHHLVPEGASDTAALLDHDFAAIGRPSASAGKRYWQNCSQIIVIAK